MVEIGISNGSSRTWVMLLWRLVTCNVPVKVKVNAKVPMHGSSYHSKNTNARLITTVIIHKGSKRVSRRGSRLLILACTAAAIIGTMNVATSSTNNQIANTIILSSSLIRCVWLIQTVQRRLTVPTVHHASKIYDTRVRVRSAGLELRTPRSLVTVTGN